jgi:hypothetical protein
MERTTKTTENEKTAILLLLVYAFTLKWADRDPKLAMKVVMLSLARCFLRIIVTRAVEWFPI